MHHIITLAVSNPGWTLLWALEAGLVLSACLIAVCGGRNTI